MTRLNIVHLDSDSIGPDIALNRPACEHRWTSYAHSEEADIVSRLGGADIAIVNKIGLDAETIGRLPALRMIAVSATGYDRIDVNACLERGIVVSNVRGYASNTVPEHTFALILSLRRGLKGYQSDVSEGKWQQSRQFCLFTQPVGDLHGSTLGRIGSGAIGGLSAGSRRPSGCGSSGPHARAPGTCRPATRHSIRSSNSRMSYPFTVP
ncbi:MAG: hypothetical protein VYE33_02600 [Pseudomonadota bacterium]|nr:hypothetical protein [Pseudomonadota bacterium]